jgi:hypothetical protein
MKSRSVADELRRRKFLLQLSVREGQEIASLVGFVPPSPEVMDSEQTDVLKNTVKLGANGIAGSVAESANWFCDVLRARLDLSAEDRDNAYNTLLCFGLATSSKLIDEGLVFPKHTVDVVVTKDAE